VKEKIISRIFKRKDNKDNEFNKYPCNVYLQNALQLIVDRKYDIAFAEICWAIIKSGGKLTKDQKEIFKNIKYEVF